VPPKIGKEVSRKVYKPSKGARHVARVKNQVFQAPADTKTEPGKAYPMKSHGNNLMVAAPGRNQMWEPVNHEPKATKGAKKEGLLRMFVREAIESSEINVDDDVNSIEVGDVVDVDVTEMGIEKVRVVSLVDDVNAEAGEPDERDPETFTGPGFIGVDEHGDELVYSLNQVVQGSKAKYYFPALGSETADGRYNDWDDYGRDVPNPYKKMASSHSTMSRERG
jgi:hypothetical protein